MSISQSILGGFSWISFLGQWINLRYLSPCDSLSKVRIILESADHGLVIATPTEMQCPKVSKDVQRSPKVSKGGFLWTKWLSTTIFTSSPARHLAMPLAHIDRMESSDLSIGRSLDPGRCFRKWFRRTGTHTRLPWQLEFLTSTQASKHQTEWTGGMQVDSLLNVAKLAIHHQNSWADSVKYQFPVISLCHSLIQNQSADTINLWGLLLQKKSLPKETKAGRRKADLQQNDQSQDFIARDLEPKLDDSKAN